MRIAFLANTSWNIYNFRKGLVHFFLNRGDEVIVLTPKDEYTRLIQKWGVQWVETSIDGTGSNPIRDFSYLLSVHNFINAVKPDIILSYTIKSNIYGSLAAKFNGIPVICNVSGLGTAFLVSGLTGKTALYLYKVAFKYATLIFFQNKDDQEFFVSHVPLKEYQMNLVPGSGINLDDFPFSVVKPSNPVKVLMISRLIVEKGIYEFIRAAEYFSDDDRVSFTLVGKLDPDHARSIGKEELDSWMNSGWISYLPHSDEIKKLIETHEVVVLPSYREGTPRTLLEGASIGRTLITSDVPGCREVVDDGFNGFLFEPKNSSDFVNKIKLYLSLNREEKIELSRNSRRLVEKRFDEKIVIDKYVDAIHRITFPG